MKEAFANSGNFPRELLGFGDCKNGLFGVEKKTVKEGDERALKFMLRSYKLIIP